MTTMSTVSDPRIGACVSCGTPLAADQRYCLGCGSRRDQARLPFQDALVPAAPPSPSPPGPAPPTFWYPPTVPAPGSSTPTILAALACVLVAFGVGLLVGRGGDAPAPVVVGAPIGGAVGAPAGAPVGTANAAGNAPTDPGSSGAAASDEVDGGKDDAPAPAEKKEADEVAKTPTTVKKATTLSESARKNLTSTDPDKAREASQSLPDAVSTGE